MQATVVALVIGSLALAACSSDASAGRRGEVGVFEDAGSGAAGSAGFDNPAPGSGGVVSSVDHALEVEVQDIEGMTIEIVTLSCAGDCADIEAVARGGHPPYSFEWEDGSRDPARRVCLSEDAQLAIEATDTAIVADEHAYEARTVRAEVTVSVLDCEDGGTPEDASVAPLCTERITGSPLGCSSASDVVLNPIEGLTLQAGVPASIRVDGEGIYALGEGWHYEVWGSIDGCSLDEQLDAFQLQNGPLNIRSCVTASRSFDHVILLYRLAPTDGVSATVWAISSCDSCD
jgi:hypothetical protein